MKVTSKFLNRFKTLDETEKEIVEKLMILRGANLLVEIVDPPENKTAGGLFIPDAKGVNTVSANALHLGIVLRVGEGYYDAETNESTPTDIQPGNLVLLPKNNLYFISLIPGFEFHTDNKLVLVNEGQISIFFKSADKFELASIALNKN